MRIGGLDSGFAAPSDWGVAVGARLHNGRMHCCCLELRIPDLIIGLCKNADLGKWWREDADTAAKLMAAKLTNIPDSIVRVAPFKTIAATKFKMPGSQSESIYLHLLFITSLNSFVLEGKKMVDRGLILPCMLLLSFAVSYAANADNVEATKEPADSKVHVIEYDHFWRFIERHPLVLMEFYAPWW